VRQFTAAVEERSLLRVARTAFEIRTILPFAVQRAAPIHSGSELPQSTALNFLRLFESEILPP
jgi:hypothetical protein